jgi:3-polyprenyl-4-hydroxybenzoate decarboxylase
MPLILTFSRSFHRNVMFRRKYKRKTNILVEEMIKHKNVKLFLNLKKKRKNHLKGSSCQKKSGLFLKLKSIWLKKLKMIIEQTASNKTKKHPLLRNNKKNNNHEGDPNQLKSLPLPKNYR